MHDHITHIYIHALHIYMSNLYGFPFISSTSSYIMVPYDDGHCDARNNLGGLGRGVFSANVGSKVIINAPSVYNSTSGQYLTLVTFGQVVQCPPGQAGNLTGLLLAAATPPSFSVAWCAHCHCRRQTIMMDVRAAVTS